MNRFERNVRIMHATAFLRGLVFFLPVFALYIQQELFTVLNVTLIVSAGAFTRLFFEVPCGAFADLFGRKNTMLIAGGLLIAALVSLSIGGSLAFFLLYAVLNGIAESLFSGTTTAIIHDSLTAGKQEHRFKRVIGVNSSLWPLGASISALFGGFLATQSLALPVVVTIIPFSLAFLLTFFLVEPTYEREHHNNLLRQIQDGFRTVVTNRQILLLSLAGFLAYAFGEVAHQLKPVFFASKEIPIAIYGIIFTVTFALSSLGYFISHDVSERFGNKSTLVWCAILTTALFVGAIYAPGIWSAVLLVSTSIFWGIRWPVVTHLINAEIASKQRVTVLSFGELANRLGLALFAPILGYVADLYTIQTTYLLIAFPTAIIAGVFLFLKPDGVKA